jgi:hypothetical protein
MAVICAVGSLCALYRQSEPQPQPSSRMLLGFVESFFASRIEAAGILETFAKAIAVEGCGHLVMLLVRRSSLLGECTSLQVGGVSVGLIAHRFFSEALCEQTANADANKPVGEKIFFEKQVDHDVGITSRIYFRGGIGMNTETRRW